MQKLGASRSFRRSEGAFLCEGPKLVGEAIRWGVPLEILVTAEGSLAARYEYLNALDQNDYAALVGLDYIAFHNLDCRI